VLAGITIGNYLGGRIADRFEARKALAVQFVLSSAACVLTIILNNVVGDWIFLWQFSWPVRTFSHVSIVFLLPSILLGTISPVIAKMALDKGMATGRTVGDIYAWGAAGSIIGTFLAGFYLIAAIGTIAIIWMVGGVLLLMAVLYRPRFWIVYLWAVIFAAVLTMGMAPIDWAESKGAALALREKPDPKVIYQDESQYSSIRVKRISETIDKRAFVLDKLMHSEIIMNDVLDLQYFYTRIYAIITRGLSHDQNKNKLSTLVIGGGGYAFPRYVEKVWPGSCVDVVEIDPSVTEAAMQAFGLERDTPINTFSMDARNYVDEVVRQNRTGEVKKRYDFIYEDAVNDYSMPYQLTTKEFNDKIAQLLNDDGVYMVNLIDAYDSARLLGAMVNTIKQTFPYVYVISEKTNQAHSLRNTFVIAAAAHQLNISKFVAEYEKKERRYWVLDDAEIQHLKEKSHGITLTDDYAPVENFLAPVVRQSSKGFLIERYFEDAKKLKEQGRLDEAIAKYKKAMQTDTSMSVKSYNDIALILAEQGKLDEAVESFRKALAYNEQSGSKDDTANIRHSLCTALQGMGKVKEASDECDKAAEEYQKRLIEEPDSIDTLVDLGDLLAGNGRFGDAAVYFQKAVNLNPTDLANQFKLIQSFELAGQLDQAIEANQKAIEFFTKHNQQQEVTKLREYRDLLEFKKSKYQK
jgi:spermidine synthase/Tfp pilus assembly protein PilF